MRVAPLGMAGGGMAMLLAFVMSDNNELGPVGRMRGEGLERCRVSCDEEEAVGERPEGC